MQTFIRRNSDRSSLNCSETQPRQCVAPASLLMSRGGVCKIPACTHCQWPLSVSYVRTEAQGICAKPPLGRQLLSSCTASATQSQVVCPPITFTSEHPSSMKKAASSSQSLCATEEEQHAVDSQPSHLPLKGTCTIQWPANAGDIPLHNLYYQVRSAEQPLFFGEKQISQRRLRGTKLTRRRSLASR